MSSDADFAATVKRGEMGERSIVGSNAQLVDTIGDYIELGFDELIVPDFTLGATAAERVEKFREFQRDVVSQIA